LFKYYRPEKPKEIENLIIYRKDDEYCSWPFNAGMWKCSRDNILVAFMNISCDYSNSKNLLHDRVETFGKIKAVRTVDGGRNWSEAATIADNIELSEQLTYGIPFVPEEYFDFSNPNTLLCCWSTPNSSNEKAKAWVKRSKDAGMSWEPAVLLPQCSIPRFQGRPSYIVRPDGVILLFLTARPENNRYDRPVVYASFDGGVNWCLISMMPCSNEYRIICPSPIILEDGRILVVVRCKPSVEGPWNELYASEDGGRTWRFVSRVNDHGDTANLVGLEDGRIFCVYGYRRPPFGIRGRVSEDEGKTWGQEIIIRDEGGSRNLGYPRAVELETGKILTAYYFNHKDDYIQMNGGGVRHIAGSILKV